MPKYILIALIIVIGLFLIMNYWAKLKSTAKNKILISIFGIIGLGFIILITLLIF